MSGLIKYEWLRLITIRSTWVMLALPIVMAAVVGWLIGHFFAPGMSPDRPSLAPTFEMLISLTPVVTLAAVFLSVIFAQSIGQEYRHGLIRVTLTQFPHRGRVLLVKVVMMSVLMLIMAAVVLAALWAGTRLGVAPSGGSVTFTAQSDVPLIIRALLYVFIFTAIAFAIALITRVIQLGIVIPIVMALLVEPIIRVVVMIATGFSGGGDPAEASEPFILRIMPFSSGQTALSTDASAWQGLLIFAIWCAVVLVPGWILFLRRDA